MTTVPGGEDSVIIPLPAAAKGKITVYIFGAFKASAFQEVAETFGEMLEKVNLQPDRLKNFYDPSANTWETNCSIEIERPIRSNL